MSEPIRVVVTIAAKPETAEEIKTIVFRLTEASRKESGCLVYEVLRNLDDPCNFMLIEEWSDLASLQAHNQTPHFHEAVSRAQPFLAKPLAVGVYKTIG